MDRPERALPLLAVLALLAAPACEQQNVVMVDADRVEVVPASASMPVGQSLRLSAEVRAAGGQALSGRTVNWISDDPDVAAADAAGLVTGLAVGTTTIRATSEGASGTAMVTVTAGPALSLSPTRVDFAAIHNGPRPGDRTVSLTNGGTGTLDGLSMAVRYLEGNPAGWLTAALGGTTAPASVVLSADQAQLPQGAYDAVVEISSPAAANSPVLLEVRLSVLTPNPAIGLGATSVAFAAAQGGGDPTVRTVGVTNAGGGTLDNLTVGVTYTVGQPSGWLDGALSGGSAPTTLTLRASLGGLAPGTYTAVARISSPVAQNSPQAVLVEFTVRAPEAVIGVTPPNLAFSAIVGAGDPPRQSVTVTNTGGGPLTGLDVSVTYSGGGATGWLTASLDGSTAPAVLTVGPLTGDLGAGTYTATVWLAASSAINSPVGVPVTFTVGAAAPAAPSDLTATAVSSSRVDLTWTDNSSDETSFAVQRSADGGQLWSALLVVGSNVTNASDTTATAGNTYRYRVRACRATLCSAFTSAAEVTMPSALPGVPGNVLAQAVSATRIDVTWEAPVDGGPVAGYRVERKDPVNAYALADSVNGQTRSITDEGLTSGTKYTYQVQACNAAGCATYSAESAATTGLLPPIADAGGPYEAAAGSNVTFDGSASSAAAGTIVSYRWEVDDREDPMILTGVTPTYSCAAAGVHAVTLTVTDEQGATDTDGTTVECLQPPAAPTNLQLVVVSSSRIDVSWNAPSGGGSVGTYRVERRGPTGPWVRAATVDGATLSIQDTGLDPVTLYRYQVQACNAAGCSSFSQEASALTLAELLQGVR